MIRQDGKSFTYQDVNGRRGDGKLLSTDTNSYKIVHAVYCSYKMSDTSQDKRRTFDTDMFRNEFSTVDSITLYFGSSAYSFEVKPFIPNSLKENKAGGYIIPTSENIEKIVLHHYYGRNYVLENIPVNKGKNIVMNITPQPRLRMLDPTILCPFSTITFQKTRFRKERLVADNQIEFRKTSERKYSRVMYMHRLLNP